MMRTPDDFTCLLRNQDKRQQLEPDMEQQTGSKLGKEYIKAIYCPSAYLTYMQSTEMDSGARGQPWGMDGDTV